MCPSLSDFGIEPGSFIRKLNNRNHWNSYADIESEDNYRALANKIFGEREGVYSLWKVTTNQEFYGVIASLTADATPQNKNIDFIWIEAVDLTTAGIAIKPIVEGKCLEVEDAHFDATIGRKEAEQLCRTLLRKKRYAERCKKSWYRSHPCLPGSAWL